MTDKPDLTKVWAENADPTDIKNPDLDEAGKFQKGWLTEVPPHTWFNYIQNNFSAALAHFNEYGVAQWDTNTVYPVGGWARSTVDGEVYVALVAQSGNEPSVSPVEWKAFSELFGITRPQEIELKSGRKNYIINGNFDIWQRGTSFSLSSTEYTADRWIGGSGNDLDRVTSFLAPTAAYGIKVTNVSQDINILQGIELPDAGVAGEFTVGSFFTLSFTARTSTPASLSVALIARDIASSTLNQVTIGETQSVGVVSSAVRYTLTFEITAAVAATSKCIAVRFTNNAGDMDNLTLSNIQLEKGSYATEFEYRPIGEELALCQRYFQVGYFIAGDNANLGTSLVSKAYTRPYPAAMRAVPTVTMFNTSLLDVSDLILTPRIESLQATVVYTTGNINTARHAITDYKLDAEL